MNLGQEFFRWEFATAVAGAIMQINPFNQPDVEAAKIEAKKITEEYEQTGELPAETPFYEETASNFSRAKLRASLEKRIENEKSLKKYLEAHLAHLQENDYFALARLRRNEPENEELAAKIREKVLESKLSPLVSVSDRVFCIRPDKPTKAARTTACFCKSLPTTRKIFQVPEQKYTFGVVKAAQARGDFQVLLDRERRALRVHLGADVKSGLEKLLALI
jgi:transaldolase/glucose-6-phosphate isomerase